MIANVMANTVLALMAAFRNSVERVGRGKVRSPLVKLSEASRLRWRQPVIA
jgi:hypothetical protein